MKKVLFLVGPHASGKTYSSKEFIKGKDNFCIVDTGPIIRQLHREQAPDLFFGDWIANLEEKYGKNITSDLICNEIGKIFYNEKYENIIIIGFRTFPGIKYTIDKLNIDDYNILYVDAPNELLYKNYLKRESTFLSFDDFMLKLEAELDSGLLELRNMALSRDCPVDYYYRTTDYDKFEEKIGEEFIQESTKKYNIKIYNPEKYIWPIKPKYKLLEHDKYGLRPYHMILGRPRFHSGFDITAKTLTPVNASISGIVVSSGLDEKIASGSAKWNERYGNKVEILDGNGRRLVYAHLREVLVKVGQYVNQNDVIGLSGCSGGARIPHLHFETRTNNTYHSGIENTIDPLEILPFVDFSLLDETFDEEPYSQIW